MNRNNYVYNFGMTVFYFTFSAVVIYGHVNYVNVPETFPTSEK